MEYHECNPGKEHIDGLQTELDHHERASGQLLEKIGAAELCAVDWERRASEPDTSTDPGEWFPPPTSGW